MNSLSDPAAQAGTPYFPNLLSSPNQYLLVTGLFRAAVEKRNITTPESVLFFVGRELLKRTLRALGEAEAESYACSMQALADNKAAAERYAAQVLKAASHEVAPTAEEGAIMNGIAPSSAVGATSWDAYNASDDFLNVLAKHGYQTAQTTQGKVTFTPPGGGRKERGQIVFYYNRRRLVAYVDNPHFEQGAIYDPTAIIAVLEHAGDRSAACCTLYEQGYGQRRAISKNSSKSYAGVTFEASSPSRNVEIGLLSDAHRAQLLASAISPALITSSRYESVRDPERLRGLGFSEPQAQNMPGLLISYTNAAGERFYQFRPDRQRPGGAKYETPPGKPGKYGLDIPDSIREEVLHGTGELWITEGSKKADAGVSAGQATVSLAGVWMFLRENAQGNKVMLPDFEVIPLSERRVVICYDSDAMAKPSVYAALRRLANGLRRRGANVRFCYLPDDGETKTGLDDYLAAGHSLDELRGLVEGKLRPIATVPIQALHADLNHHFDGIVTFGPKRAQLTDEASHNDALNAMRKVFQHQFGFTEECKFLYGDLYARLKLDHGTKLKTLEQAVGKNNAAHVEKWAVVCRAFFGERDYFRDILPMSFLLEIAPYGHEAQDTLLTEYLAAQENQERMTREQIRARIRELDGLPTSEEETKIDGERLRPKAKGDALMLQTLVRFMDAETRADFHALQDEQGDDTANKLLAAQFQEMLRYAVHRARENAVIAEEAEEVSTIEDAPLSIEEEYKEGEEEAGSKVTPAELLPDTEPEPAVNVPDALQPFTAMLAALEAGILPKTCIRLPDGNETRNLHNYVKEQRRRYDVPELRENALEELRLCYQALDPSLLEPKPPPAPRREQCQFVGVTQLEEEQALRVTVRLSDGTEGVILVPAGLLPRRE